MTDTTPEQAIQESARCDACEKYFKPRPQLDTGPFNRVFEAGFDFGYKSLADQVDRLTAERDAANAVATRLTMQHEVAKHQVRQLTAELGDLPEAQAAMMREIKALKAETKQAYADRARTAGELMTMTAERDALRAFAIGIMSGWPESCVDEGDMQDLAIKHGLLKLKDPKPTEPCGEGCACAEYFSEADWAGGVECYRRNELLTGEKP